MRRRGLQADNSAAHPSCRRYRQYPEEDRGTTHRAMRVLSTFGFFLMFSGIVGQLLTHSLFSTNPAVIAVQAAAFGLMLWARITFGRRSFHFSAKPTDGGLVTSGPYALMRHPIYAAVCYFVIAGALANLPKATSGFSVLVLIDTAIRTILEERRLLQQYPGYAAYSRRTKRLVPFVF
jgi:protein-S-isoprenylcysteine O-methyltransferase Ste14